MEVLLDTNFIISCLKKKIDIEEELKKIDEKIEIILTKKILEEIKKFKEKKEKKGKDKKLTELFLKMLEENAIKVRIIEAKQKNPDESLRVYCEKNPSCILATLDKKLRKRVKNKILTIKGEKIEFI